ncbi:MAG: gamma-glutamyl kinase, glutamate 5-kinase [Candidatus Peregrinibacteria bacterium GW2011_GWC2_39_14]|nr:MAG: Glutamate 5-kinase [Candidatus Peregrinibacteria bacterium GW2011_GWA2_38_36]KKR04668.1 MAG: gamma-glutamyl kinase, glutamate 5-kinase [Candidatus Peregrinibacteria bacterium GW2011_GWC2_39_14]
MYNEAMSQTLVIKVGSALVTKEDNTLNTNFIGSFVEQIAALKKSGHKIIIVTSGAVASGRSEMKLEREDNIPYKQALAAIGQGILMNTYRDFFKKHEIVTAQVLLTNLDFKNRESFITTRNTLELLTRFNAIPIINENDVTAYAEIKFGDNDNLASKVAAMVDADKLIILTSVKGFYTDDPTKNPSAELIRELSVIDGSVKKLAKGAGSKKSLGGMSGKIKAAEFASNSGITTYIASGNDENIISNIIGGVACDFTVIHPMTEKHTSKQNWFKSQVKAGCGIIIDDGAVKALKERGKSLLPVGVSGIKGKFERGDFVEIYAQNGDIIAIGETNYSSLDLEKFKGCKNGEACYLAGAILDEEVVHRDNMVIF